MSLSKLSKLPPEVLSCVLNNEAIPLSRRLCLRLLCNRWADIIEEGLKRETSLVVRDEMVEHYYLKPKPDDLVIKSTDLTDDFTRPLSRLFTSLTQLSFNFGVPASLSKLSSLLAHLDNLTTVNLYGSCVDTEQIEPIAAALTALSRLTSLTLFGYGFSNRLLPHLKPVLSRLEKFGSFGDSFDLLSLFSSSLSPQCTHLWLTSNVFQSFPSPFRGELSNNLTHLHLAFCDANIWQSISQMHNVSSLTLDFITYKPDLDSSFFSHLAPFTRLTQVKLLNLSYRTPLALPSNKETPLSTVKRLTLEVDFDNSPVHYAAFFSAISAWFPALLHLSILVDRDIIAAIEASLGKVSFAVKIGDRESVDIYSTDW